MQPWGGRVEFELTAGAPPPSGATVDFALTSGDAYISPSQPTVDFNLGEGYASPLQGAVNFTLGSTPPPEPGVVALYKTVAVPFGRAREPGSVTVAARYTGVPEVQRVRRVGYGRPAALQAALRGGWSGIPQIEVKRRAKWDIPTPAGAHVSASWRFPGQPDAGGATRWNTAAPRDATEAGNDWGVVTPHDGRMAAEWGVAALPAAMYDAPPYITRGGDGAVVPRGDHVLFALAPAVEGNTDHINLEQRMVYRPAVAQRDTPAVCNFDLRLDVPAAPTSFLLYGQFGYLPPPSSALSANLPDGYLLPPALAADAQLGLRSTPTVVDPPPIVQHRADPGALRLCWGDVPTRDARNHLPWGPGGRYPGRDPITGLPWVNDPPEPPAQPPALKVHIVMNNVSVVRLPDMAPIEVTAVDLSANVDAWCWSVRMELADPTQAGLLAPDGSGPKVVQITMNSYVWTAIIEGRSRSRGFGPESVTVVGRSQTALLDAPYAPRRSSAEPEARTAQQLAAAELANTGFTLDWSGVDWLVPGGAWYYSDLTPAAVINDIAAAGGAILQSDPSAATLAVKPRYPVAPWGWSAATADLVLPASWVVDDSTQYASRPLVDAVIVRGEQQGVQARVIRTGSAGEHFADQVVHKLITHVDVAVQRATTALGDSGEQELVDLRIPLFVPGTETGGATGLYLPLNLVEVQDLASNWRGLSVGVSISARRSSGNAPALEVWQNVSLERHLTHAG